MTVAISALSPHANVKIIPADPRLSADAGGALVTALDKLFAQFAREGRLSRWSVTVEGDGALLVIAYEASEALSGCSHDKVAKLLLTHEERGGSRLLSAPPIVIELAGQARCVDRVSLRKLVENGAVTLDSRMWDVRAETLGAWRAASGVPVRNSWLAPLIARAAAMVRN